MSIEKPILFSGPMVRAILDGRKTMTRRVVRDQSSVSDIAGGVVETVVWWPRDGDIDTPCPYGEVGDHLWVREKFYIANVQRYECGIGFAADHPTGNLKDGDGGYDFRPFPDDDGESWNWAQKNQGAERWKPSIFIPRWASRITLEITNVRVERLNEISEEDAKAEGAPEICDHCGNPPESEPHWACEPDYDNLDISHRTGFRRLWDSINGNKHPWDNNPWVWVLEFKLANIGQIEENVNER